MGNHACFTFFIYPGFSLLNNIASYIAPFNKNQFLCKKATYYQTLKIIYYEQISENRDSPYH